MNGNQSGYMTIEDVNTVIDDEYVKITDFDDEQEGKVVDVDNGEEDH